MYLASVHYCTLVASWGFVFSAAQVVYTGFLELFLCF